MHCCYVTAMDAPFLNYVLCGYFVQVLKHRKGTFLSRRSGMSKDACFTCKAREWKVQDIKIHKVVDFLRTRCYRDSEHETQIVILGVRLTCRLLSGCKI
jgi:hypothetical protein